jgi:hypothetical protein
VSHYSALAARGWCTRAATMTFIMSVPFVAPVSAHAQAMSDMEHEHHDGPAASQPVTSTPRAKASSHRHSGAQKHQRAPRPAQTGAHGQHAVGHMQHDEHGMAAMPGMKHGEHGMEAMPGMQHREHGMRGMQMKGQFGPYSMQREASGTAWQPDSTPHQGVMS